MHPSKFFEEIRVTSAFKNKQELAETKEFLKSIHPMNIMGAVFQFEIVEMEIEHTTKRGNIKYSKKYAIMQLDVDSGDDLDMQAQIWADSAVERYNIKHLDSQMQKFNVISAKVIERVALDIG